MSNLSELLPAGGAAKEFEPVASGTLPNGQAVVLKADGTVEVIFESSTPVTESIPAGSEVTFNSASTSYTSVSFDPNTAGKFVVVYVGSSSYGTAVVGTVSGTSISFGSEYAFNSGATEFSSVSFDPNTAGKFVAVYRDSGNANYGTAIVGTVSGTAISFGSEYVFNSATSEHPSVAFDPNTAGKFLLAYKDGGNSS